MHCVLTRFSLPWLSKFEVAGWHESECVRVSFLLSFTDANRPFSVQTTIHNLFFVYMYTFRNDPSLHPQHLPFDTHTRRPHPATQPVTSSSFVNWVGNPTKFRAARHSGKN